ncbi:PoNe immunity protein domain-containing protein [Pseudomonas sp. JR33AA]|uniref:PoNe immunity protein domain-containing protein n=1 Tax=Pseudomonas sp. JR33AA TaxID=2899113 RepID=UPI001F201766|nr:PoNe immunity protein domain-containing protein [Pseudomonas sp. JR33AA]MCE5978422.1 DUF1911 domain-containing protein [Pseudomonas sp. JR33AA]
MGLVAARSDVPSPISVRRRVTKRFKKFGANSCLGYCVGSAANGSHDHLGYWAFKAALVAFLWSVPGDALESAPHFFPKALIARAHYRGLGKQFRDPESARREDAPGWPSGTPCPWPGHYTCVERSVGEQVFMHQTPFPKIDGQVVHWRLSRTF